MRSTAWNRWSFSFGVLIVLALLAAGKVVTAPLAFSQESGSVDAVVTIDGVCLTLSTNSIDYGTQSFSTSLGGNNIANRVGPTLTNCGSTNLDIAAEGTGASDGNLLSWALSDTDSGVSAVCPTLNTYGHFISDLGLNEVDLDVLPQAFLAGVAPATGVPTDASLVLPCSGSDGAGQQFAFSIVYSASAAGGGGVDKTTATALRHHRTATTTMPASSPAQSIPPTMASTVTVTG